MAEINIEKKKKPVWPWILLVIILLLLGWAVYELVLKDGQTTAWSPLTDLLYAQTAHCIPETTRT